MIAREEWLGVGMMHRPCLTYPGQHQYGLSIYFFLVFKDIKAYMYYIFKCTYSIKEHWWTLTLSWPDKVQRMFSTAHEFSNEKLNHRRFYDYLYKP